MSSTDETETKPIGGLTGSIAYSLIVLGLLLVIVPSLMSLTDQIDNIQDLPIIFIVLLLVGASFVAIGFITYIVIFSLRISKKPKEKKEKPIPSSDKEEGEDLEFLEEVKEDLAEEEAVDEAIKEAIEDAMEETIEEIDEELDEEIVEEIAEEVTEEILQEEEEEEEDEEVIEEVLEEAVEEAIENAVEDTVEDVAEDISKEILEEADEGKEKS